jgi:hypothetical protein
MVGRVPHETVVAAMRHDVVDDRRRFGPSGIPTANAQRVRLQVGDAVALPPRGVATGRSGSALGVLFLLPLGFVASAHTPALHQHATSRTR